MLTANDLAWKFQIVPGAVLVTYTQMNPQAAPLTVAGARKRPVTEKEAAALGVKISLDTAMWILPTVNMPGVTPRDNDKITDPAGQDWIVQPQNVSGLIEAEWKLICYKAVG